MLSSSFLGHFSHAYLQHVIISAKCLNMLNWSMTVFTLSALDVSSYIGSSTYKKAFGMEGGVSKDVCIDLFEYESPEKCWNDILPGCTAYTPLSPACE